MDFGRRHHWYGDCRLQGLEEYVLRLTQGDFFDDLVGESLCYTPVLEFPGASPPRRTFVNRSGLSVAVPG